MLLGLGNLTLLEVVPATNPQAPAKRITLHKRLLGWDKGRKAFHVCRRVRRISPSKLPAAVIRAHQEFHHTAPSGCDLVDLPSPKGKLRVVGLLKALAYVVPKSVKSPGKNGYIWHHTFGDTGHKGGKYPPRVMPLLKTDGKNYFIVRRKGNIFNVDEWLRG